MTETPKPPKPASNLYERIRARDDPFGGIDLELPPREPGREPPCFDDMSSEEVEALVDEAVAVVRSTVPESGEDMS